MSEQPTRAGIVTRFHGMLLMVLVAITVIAYAKIPAEMNLPVHWGFNGEPDTVWPKDQALLVAPIAATVLTGILALVGRFAPVEQVEPGRHVITHSLSGVLALFVAVQFGILLVGIGSDINVFRLVAGAMTPFLLILGNELRSAQPQPYAGLRLPWAVRHGRAWAMSHQVTGALLMAGGVALGLCAWLWPDPETLVLALLGAVVGPLLIGGAVSYFASKRP